MLLAKFSVSPANMDMRLLQHCSFCIRSCCSCCYSCLHYICVFLTNAWLLNQYILLEGFSCLCVCDPDKCSAGYRPTADQENCEKCPRGTYQPQPDQTDCLPCMGAKMDTRTDGAVLESECESKSFQYTFCLYTWFCVHVLCWGF